MNKLARITGLGILGTLLLAGCGSLVGGAIPPQTVDDVAGLNGVELESEDFVEGEDLVQSLAAGGSFSFTKQFNNIAVNIPLGIQPQTISFNLNFKRARSRGNCPSPDSFALKVTGLKVRLSEGGTATANATFGDFTLNMQKASDGAYNVMSVQPGQPTVNLDNGVLAFNMITSGAQPNEVRVSGRMSTASGFLGCRLVLVVDSAKATFSTFR